jgi:uncharacterized protein (TIGR02099 family)
LAALLWWGSASLAGLFALAWLAIYGLIVPRIGELRPELENRLSAALGVPVKIGAIEARVQGLMPSFEMSQVRLLDPQGRDALVLKTVTAAVSPHSLLSLGFEQLLIEQPELELRRDSQGKITLAGLAFAQADRQSTEPSAGADWLFSQSEIVIRSGTLRWIDEQHAKPPLALSQVNLYVRNEGRQHQLRMDATPPAILGERFTLTGDFQGLLFNRNPGDWRTWQGQIYADFPSIDITQWQPYLALGTDIGQGRGQLRGWLEIDRAKLVGATTDVALADVNARLRQDLQPLLMNSLAGRLSFRQTDSSLALRTEQLTFELKDGMRWPGGNVSLTLDERQDASKASGQFSADKLDLAALAQISDRLPLDVSVHEWLRATQPQGQLPKLQASWKGLISAPQAYQVEGSAKAIQWLASHETQRSTQHATPTTAIWHPGVRNAQIDFKFSEASGTAQLRVDQGSISLPGVFEEPTVALDQFSTTLDWQIKGEHMQLHMPQFKFANKDTQGEGSARWQTANPATSRSKSRFPGLLDLQGTIERADGTRVHRYLPMVVPREARHYVRDAVLQGKASQGTFKIKGDLFDMPFTDPSQGEFRIAAQVTGAVLDYVPRSALPAGSLPWPALTQINGQLIFDRQSMAVKDATARIAGSPSLQLAKVEAVIANLTENQQVAVSADARGNAVDVLGIVNNSPLRSISDEVLTQATINGAADVKLRMLLPIDALDKSRVQGTVTLAGNDLQFSPQSPALQLARGQISFNEKGFALREASARVFGGEVRLEGASRPNPGPNDVTVALRAVGTVTAEGLRQAKELGFVSRLAMQASGSAAYAASMSFRRGKPEISVTSNLQGLALSLPQPMLKAADALLPIRYDSGLLRESLIEGRKLQDQFSLEVGTIATIQYQRDVSGSSPRVIKGRIGVGLGAGEAIAANDEPGVAANINFAQLDMDAWERILANASGTTPAPSGRNAAAELSAETLTYLPSVMSIRARELTLQGRTLNNVVVGGSRDNLTWRANLDARELNGYVEYRQPSANNPGRVYARLARLSLAASTASDIEATLDQQPSSIPALDVVVEDFELRGKRLGRVELEATNRESAGVREWRLSRLNLSLPEAQFTASGNWAQLGGSTTGQRSERRRTALNFKLDLTDSGELLKRLGQDKVITRGKGVMQGQIAWLGAPWAMDYSSMNGGFNVMVESGQFLKVEPGLAKLLSVLSLQSLPRRLALDFRDVFTEGFSFDFIRGDIKIEQGIASTNNLQMKGVNAAVLMEGSANIARETQDLKVVVIPEINAGTASLVATAINPAIGLGTFLAQWILRRPVRDAATQEFRITGSWTDPQVERIKRSNASAAAPASNNDGKTTP